MNFAVPYKLKHSWNTCENRNMIKISKNCTHQTDKLNKLQTERKGDSRRFNKNLTQKKLINSRNFRKRHLLKRYMEWFVTLSYRIKVAPPLFILQKNPSAMLLFDPPRLLIFRPSIFSLRIICGKTSIFVHSLCYF